MAEVSGFLTNNDLFRTRLARTLDLYSRDSLSSDLPHDEHESNLDDNRNLDLSSSHLEPTPQRPGINRLFSHHASSGTPDFDRLASLNGLHNTENLIEAIFNPVPTMSKEASPFTYFSPEDVASANARDEDSLSKRSGSLGGDEASISSVSGQSQGSGGRGGTRKNSSNYARSELSSLSNEGREFGIKDFFSSSHDDGTNKTHWWQKMGGGSRSRPETPNVGTGMRKLFGASSTRLPLEVE